MYPFIKSRFSSWAEMFKAKLMWLLAGIWTLVGVFDLVKTEFLPERFQSYTALRGMLFFSWRTWIFVLLLILIGVILEGGHAAITKRDERINLSIKETANTKAQLLAQLDEEISKRGRPEVIAICDWKRNERDAIQSNMKSILLKTLTEMAALDVQVHSIEQELGTVSFKDISLLSGNSEIKPYCSGEFKTSLVFWDLFSLVKESYESSGKKMSDLEIPITIDYRDTHGLWHQSLNVLRYDWFLGTGQIHNIGFRRKF
jgi:uncharacterized membrane protein